MMKGLRFFGSYVILTWGRLCQQRWLLAGLALLCLLVPLGAGQAADFLLSRGVDFHPVTLAVTAPEGDRVPKLLERYMGDMEDIAQYCQIVSMGEEEARAALEQGEVTAVLALPENFIRGVMWGENPDLRLLVKGERPLESLLLLWVGQSACDILSAFQSGVYAVLELYEQAPPSGLTRDQVVMDVNLEYINLALNRTSFFQTREVLVTQNLPISLHYSLSLLSYFALSAAPVFLPIYGGGWLRFQRRLRSVGRGCGWGYFSAVTAGTGALLLLLAPALLLSGEGKHPLALLAVAVLMAAFCSVFCGLCCLAARSAAGCGALAFGTALAALAGAGGIVPAVLLPGPVRRLIGLSPVTWLTRLAAWPMGWPLPSSAWIGLTATGVGMLLCSLVLYRREMDRQEVPL